MSFLKAMGLTDEQIREIRERQEAALNPPIRHGYQITLLIGLDGEDNIPERVKLAVLQEDLHLLSLESKAVEIHMTRG